MRITSKKLMYELQDKRLLGNTLPALTWGDFMRLGPNPPRGRFGLRHRFKTGFKFTKPVGNWTAFVEYVVPLVGAGELTFEDVLCTDITELDDTRKTLQGEIMVDDRTGELCLYHSGLLYQTWTCRDEMRQPTGVVERRGLTARAYIETFMDQRSQDTLEELLRKYPGNVIEVSCFTYRLGWDRANTLFWETRAY